MNQKVEKKSKVGRPKTTGPGEQVNVRLLPDLLGAIDRQKEATGSESRAEVLRRIATDYFKRKGWL